MNNKKSKIIKSINKIFFIILIIILFFLFVNLTFAGNPIPPSSIVIISNETKEVSNSSGTMLNTSGSYITTINISTISQNLRWKAFVGWVTGKYALDNVNGSTIYDWTMISTTGNVYATRNSSIISWSNIVCANNSTMHTENLMMNHTKASDNITATFSRSSTHQAFSVGTVSFNASQCPTLNTYVGNTTQDTYFEEMALYDGSSSLIYATIMNPGKTGYDSKTYDFQLIVPENGLVGFSGATAYYLYVEIS